MNPSAAGIKGDRMTFSEALEILKAGMAVSRLGWNGEGMWIAIAAFPDEEAMGMDRAFIYMRPVDGQLIPWTASHADLLADDWMEVSRE